MNIYHNLAQSFNDNVREKVHEIRLGWLLINQKEIMEFISNHPDSAATEIYHDLLARKVSFSDMADSLTDVFASTFMELELKDTLLEKRVIDYIEMERKVFADWVREIFREVQILADRDPSGYIWDCLDEFPEDYLKDMSDDTLHMLGYSLFNSLQRFVNDGRYQAA